MKKSKNKTLDVIQKRASIAALASLKKFAKALIVMPTGTGTKNNPRPRKRKPIRCIETGKIYPSITIAAETMNTNQSNISRACIKGTISNGYHFEYVYSKSKNKRKKK